MCYLWVCFHLISNLVLLNTLFFFHWNVSKYIQNWKNVPILDCALVRVNSLGSIEAATLTHQILAVRLFLKVKIRDFKIKFLDSKRGHYQM